ncbi:hypothetical protein Rhe02_05980 [Rhizocola hellebori]|uniref:Secreted protein n=1 Tax=Rhizocola hellebori TaxID=1392758 RepID=A0A8J3VDK4_9ACTN|nr:hypothetical protein [Rhizocola hellebori]GIH02531.1 hypothetical protein Rhe02_05980 [Rhizocola hellebori]
MTLSPIARWQRQAAVLLLAAASLTVAAAPPATAVTRQPLVGLVMVSDTDPTSDDSIKLASVTCPNNKTVVGMGFSVNPASAQLRLQILKPFQHSVIAQVHEDYNWYNQPWSLSVYAMCAEQPPGWTLVSHIGATNSDNYHSVRSDCPGETKPLAAGVEQSTGQGQIVVTDVDLDLTGVKASAYEYEDGTNATWWIRSYAICADPPTGWELQSSDNQTSYPTTTEYTTCTAGRKALSAGVDLNGAHGEVALTSLRPGSYQADQFGVASASEDETGTPDDWELSADVICVD